jgi:hypothetical protein
MGADAGMQVFYHKMKGDYHRYLAEFASGDTRKGASEAAHESYKTASTIASSELAPTHPIRLGLALNFSVFYYEILNSPDKVSLRARRPPHASDASLSRPVVWPRLRSTTPLPSSTRSPRRATRTRL